MPLLGELFALITAVLWSVSALLFSDTAKKVGSFQVNVTRLLFGLSYIILWSMLMRYPVNLKASQILYFSVSGVIGLALGDTFLFKAFREIGARISLLIMSFAPAVAAVIAYVFLGESLTETAILGILITLSGISMVVLDRGGDGEKPIPISLSGIVYALLGAVGQGVGLIFAKMAFSSGEVNGFVATAIRLSASLIILVPLGLYTRRFSNPFSLIHHDRKSFWLIVIAAFLGAFLGISFSMLAVKYTHVGIAGTIMSISPVLMLPLVHIFYKEHLTWKAIAGAFLAVAGVAVLFLR